MDDKFRLDRGGLALLWSKIAKILRGKQPKHNINGSAVSNSTDVYAPTSAGTSKQVLVSNGSGAPTWVNQTFGNIKGDATNSNHCVKVTHNATSGRHVFKVWSDSNGWLQEALVLLQSGSLVDCINTAARNIGGNYQRFRAYSIDANNFIIAGLQYSYIYVQTDNRVEFSVAQTTDEYMSLATLGDNIVDWANQAKQAKQATKLTTAKTLQTDLGSTTPASFDGSANASIGVTGVLPVANGGTGKSSLELVRVGEAVVADKADRIAVTAESGVGAITDVDVHIVTALPSDASSYPDRIYLVISPQSQVTQVDTQTNNI